MAINRSAESKPVSVAEVQLARVSGDGSARHSHLTTLLEGTGRHSGRDMADAVHLLCSLHGHYPGLIEIALQRCPKGAVAEWLSHASDSFERERLYLVRLTSAVGPLPSTPGAAETEASLVAARHALETLATSERDGELSSTISGLSNEPLYSPESVDVDSEADWWGVVIDEFGLRYGDLPTEERARVWGMVRAGHEAWVAAGGS